MSDNRKGAVMNTYTVKGKSLIYGHHFEVEVEATSYGEAAMKFEQEYLTAFAIEVDGRKLHR